MLLFALSCLTDLEPLNKSFVIFQVSENFIDQIIRVRPALSALSCNVVVMSTISSCPFVQRIGKNRLTILCLHLQDLLTCCEEGSKNSLQVRKFKVTCVDF